jgi:predicted O-methyltransferase YrrM
VQVHRLPSAEAALRFPDGHFDFVYIDGDHHEQKVREDLAAWGPKVRPGGIIGGDDYGLEGWWHDGVTRAVEEFVASGRAEQVMIDGTQFALRVLND